MHSQNQPDRKKNLKNIKVLRGKSPDTPIVRNTGPSGNDHPLYLGLYDIVGILRSGRFAVVYEGYDRKSGLKRAIKLVKKDAPPMVIKCFEANKSVSALLKHPNIVEVHSFGEFNGLPYIEMEKLEGVDLEEILRVRPQMPFPVVTAIAVMVCRALLYAHTLNRQSSLGYTFNNIVHSDIKPSHIVLLNSGVVKIIDFGSELTMCRIDGKNTEIDWLMSSIQYIAPEKMDGLFVDFSADIYSFGVVLYEMVTGSKAFSGSTVHEVMKDVKINNVVPIRKLMPQTPNPLCTIIEQCMETDRLYRIHHTAELLDRFEELHKRLSPREDPVDIVRNYLENDGTLITGEPTPSAYRRMMLRLTESEHSLVSYVRASVSSIKCAMFRFNDSDHPLVSYIFRHSIPVVVVVSIFLVIVTVGLMTWAGKRHSSLPDTQENVLVSAKPEVSQKQPADRAAPRPSQGITKNRAVPRPAQGLTKENTPTTPGTPRSFTTDKKQPTFQPGTIPSTLKPGIVPENRNTKPVIAPNGAFPVAQRSKMQAGPVVSNTATSGKKMYTNTGTDTNDPDWRNSYIDKSGITAEEPVWETEKISNEDFLRQLRLSVKSNSMEELGKQLLERQIDDGEYYLYMARYKLSRNELYHIPILLQKAQSVKCREMDPEKLRIEIAYTRAKYLSLTFYTEQNVPNAHAALEAWEKVKSQFFNTPENVNSIEAEKEISRISDILHAVLE